MLVYAKKPVVILFCLVFLLQACNKQGSEQKPAEITPPSASGPAFTPRTIPVPQNVTFSDVQSTFAAPKNLVVTDPQEFKKIWQEIYREQFPHPSLPDVDFSKEMVIVAFMGEQPTSGYSIDIIEVTEYADRIEVQIVKHKPAQDATVAQVITRPFCLAKIEKIGKPARFIEVNTGALP
jgi:hypothetical protein